MNCLLPICVPLAALALGALPCFGAVTQTFSGYQLVNPSSTPRTTEVLAHDVNGDGRVDVAVVSRANGIASYPRVSGSVTLHRLEAGGVFSSGRELLRSEVIYDADFGDLDSDGDVDLLAVVAETFGATEMVRMENLGAGRFLERERFPVAVQTARVWISDIDGDGWPDALQAGRTDSSLSEKIWARYGQGGGLLGPETLVVDAQTGIATVLLMDVDRDGLDDIVFDTEAEPTLSLGYRLEWVQQAPGGGFGTIQTIQMGVGGNTPMVAIDVDSDGAKDLVRLRDHLDWYRNRPIGAFAARQPLVTELQDVEWMTVCDLEGDGDEDLFCFNDGFADTRLWSVVNDDGTFMRGEQTLQSIFGGVCGLVGIDVNGDGLVDPVWSGGDGPRAELQWSPRTPGVPFPFSTPVSDPIRPARLAVGSFDSDDDVEVLSLGETVRYFDRSPLGGFERSLLFAAPPVDEVTPGRPTVEDLDGDGIQDAAFTSLSGAGGQDALVVIPGAVGGPAAAQVLTIGGTGNGHPCALDVDLDGDLDLVVPSTSLGALRVFAGDGLGNFTPAPSIDASVQAASCQASDVDSDGLMDLLVNAQGPSGSVVYLYRQSAIGFEPRTVVAEPTGDVTSFAIVDANGDPLRDVVLTVTDGDVSLVELYQHSTPGQFSAASVVGSPMQSASFRYENVVSGDLTGDGVDDLALRVRYDLYILRGLGQGSFAPPVILPRIAGPGDMIAVDMEGDFDLDLAVTDEVNRTARWLENQHLQGTSYCDSTPNSTQQIAQLDFGGSDIAFRNASSLTAQGLPSQSVGYFLISASAGFTANPGGSEGNLCLGGAIGRYRRPGEVGFSGMTGRFTLQLNLTDTPAPGGTMTVLAGQMLHYQAWFRDTNSAGTTSNFTSAVRVTFR